MFANAIFVLCVAVIVGAAIGAYLFIVEISRMSPAMQRLSIAVDALILAFTHHPEEEKLNALAARIEAALAPPGDTPDPE